jgi:hypothetical protein
MTDPAIRASATGVVYRDVSEAFWKAGDHERAIAVFKEGLAAGGDQYLFMSAAAHAVEQQKAREQQSVDQQPADQPATDKKTADKKPADNKSADRQPPDKKTKN